MLEAAQGERGVVAGAPVAGPSADVARLLAAGLGAARDPCFLLDRARRVRFANDSGLLALGLARAGLVGRTWQEAGLSPGLVAPLGPGLARALEAGEGADAELVLPGRAGTRTFDCRIEPVRDEAGEIVGALIVAREIDRRRQAGARAEVERERRRLELILDNVSEAIAAVFVDTGATVRNRAWLDFHGFASFAELGGWGVEEVAPLFEMWGPDGRLLPVSEAPLLRALRGEAFRDLEIRLRRRDNGRTWWGSYNGSALKDEAGRVVAALISMRDTTLRHEAEAAIRESEARFRRAVTAAAVPIMLHAEDGEVLAVSEGLLAATGYTRGQLARFEDWLALAYRERAAERGRSIRRRFERDLPIPGVEVEVHTGSGERRAWVWHAPPPERLADGRKCIFAIGSDITERKQAELLLRASEERLQLAQEAGGIGAWDWDIPADEAICSASYYRLYGLEPGDGPQTAEQFLAAVHPEDRGRVANELQRAIAGAPYDTEYRTVWPTGEVRWIHARARLLRDAQGRPWRLTGVSMDVTATKEAEARLEALVGQRDMLLAELNHRVKNNLQLVTSLLKLQAMRSGAPEALRLVEEASQRIGAIAQVHATLYQGDLLGQLEFSAYLRDLCARLAASFLEGEGGRMGLEVEAAPLRLRVDQAIPLGLIVNELVTDAFRHGLARGAGRVRVRLGPAEAGAWRLEVADDGGPGDDGERAGDGLGMQLVEGFARQLRGTLRIERAPGWRVAVDFPP